MLFFFLFLTDMLTEKYSTIKTA